MKVDTTHTFTRSSCLPQHSALAFRRAFPSPNVHFNRSPSASHTVINTAITQYCLFLHAGLLSGCACVPFTGSFASI